MRRSPLPVIVAALLVVAGCASGSTTPGTPTVSAAAEATTDRPMTESMTAPTTAFTESMNGSMTSAESAPTGTVITTGASEYGQMLFDGNQQAIYLFDKETAGISECYDDCAAAWPPVLTTGEPIAAGGIVGALLGTTDRADGTTQVTYGGHPLYFYENEDPGEVKCHDVRGFGGLWLVVTPSGQPAPA